MTAWFDYPSELKQLRDENKRLWAAVEDCIAIGSKQVAELEWLRAVLAWVDEWYREHPEHADGFPIDQVRAAMAGRYDDD
jgi:hypothetical protein